MLGITTNSMPWISFPKTARRVDSGSTLSSTMTCTDTVILDVLSLMSSIVPFSGQIRVTCLQRSICDIRRAVDEASGCQSPSRCLRRSGTRQYTLSALFPELRGRSAERWLQFLSALPGEFADGDRAHLGQRVVIEPSSQSERSFFQPSFLALK